MNPPIFGDMTCYKCGAPKPRRAYGKGQCEQCKDRAAERYFARRAQEVIRLRVVRYERKKFGLLGEALNVMWNEEVLPRPGLRNTDRGSGFTTYGQALPSPSSEDCLSGR